MVNYEVDETWQITDNLKQGKYISSSEMMLFDNKQTEERPRDLVKF